MPGTSVGLPVALVPARLAEDRIDRVICLVPEEEVLDRSPAYFGAMVRGELGVDVEQLPVKDWAVPDDPEAFLDLAEEVARRLRLGERLLVHCAGGCGRTGTFCCCVLVILGATPEEAVTVFRATRGCGPETADQEAFVARAVKRDRTF
jgi:protein-tyrosine phosphatase